MIAEKKVREKDFDIDGFLNVLEPFYKGCLLYTSVSEMETILKLK